MQRLRSSQQQVAGESGEGHSGGAEWPLQAQTSRPETESTGRSVNCMAQPSGIGMYVPLAISYITSSSE